MLKIIQARLQQYQYVNDELPDVHTDFSRGRSVGLVFPSLEEFSTVFGDQVKCFGRVNKAKIDVFLEHSFSMIQWMLAI